MVLATLTTGAAIVSKKLLPKTMVKLLTEMTVFFLNVFCLCMFDWWGSQKSEKKKLRTRDTHKKRYGKDVLAMMENPRYNPISDPTFDLDKYKQISAGVLFLCEGEVLLLQRHSRKDDDDSDFCFGLPGGTVMYEDFDQYYNSLLTRKEYKKKLKDAPKEVRKSIEAHASSFASGVFETVDGIGDKLANFTNPQAPEQELILIDDDSLNGAVENQDPDVYEDDGGDGDFDDDDDDDDDDGKKKDGKREKKRGSSDLDNGDETIDGEIEDRGNEKKKKKKKKGKRSKKGKKNEPDDDGGGGEYGERIRYPQVPLYDAFFTEDVIPDADPTSPSSLRNMKRKVKKKNRYTQRRDFTLSYEQGIRHYNHGFGFDGGTWHGAVRTAREDLGDTFPNLITPVAIFNLYRGGLSSVDPHDEDPEYYDNDGEDYEDFDVEAQTLMPKMSLMGNGKVVGDNFRRYTLYVCNVTPEERNQMTAKTETPHGWFPLCLLLSMHSTFRQFSLHPWLISFIQQYSTQFDKLARPTFWVGFNRHFPANFVPPTAQQQLPQLQYQEPSSSPPPHKSLSGGAVVDDVPNTIEKEANDRKKELDQLRKQHIKNSSVVFDDSEPEGDTTNARILNLAHLTLADGDEKDDPKSQQQQPQSNTPDVLVRNDKILRKKLDPYAFENDDGSQCASPPPNTTTLNLDPYASTLLGTNSESQNLNPSDIDVGIIQKDYYDTDEPTVDYDPDDIFIRFFLPLVKKFINPRVYT